MLNRLRMVGKDGGAGRVDLCQYILYGMVIQCLGSAKVFDFLFVQIYFNPFTAPACNISGLNSAWTHLQNGIFFAPNIYFQCCAL